MSFSILFRINTFSSSTNLPSHASNIIVRNLFHEPDALRRIPVDGFKPIYLQHLEIYAPPFLQKKIRVMPPA